MKQILKTIFICFFLCLPVSVIAQEDFTVSEPTIITPIVDNGFAQLQTEPEMLEVLPVEETTKKTVTPVASVDLQPLIHIEQLNWNTFKFRSSYRLGLEDDETKWDFGDGQSSTERIVHHTYNGPGIYQVQLEIRNESGEVKTVSSTVQVGFFNLANWRLWILILLLAIIIIIGAVIAGVTEDTALTPENKKKDFLDDLNEDTFLNTLNDDLGDLDSLGQIGMDTHELAKELAFLEEMDQPKKPKKTAKRKSTRSTSTKRTTKKKTTTKEKKKKTVRKKKASTAKSTKSKTKKSASKKTSTAKKKKTKKS